VTPDYSEWARTAPEGRFTDWLRERAEPSWSAACGHRFGTEIADGSLDEAVFRRYLVQDYAFIETLATVLGFAVARAPGMAAKKRLTGFLAALTSDENGYFIRAFDAVGVAEGERTAPELAPVTRDFRAAMLAAAEAGTYEDLLAVIVPAEWIYLTWASEQAEAAPSQLHYREWIELHIDPAFAAFVDWLRSELDCLGPSLTEVRRQEIESRFQHLVELEVAFFEQAYG
jgi:thiaminase/transcriptional activator TenA